MQNSRNEELADLRAELVRIGAQLGADPRHDETSVAFAARCVHAARRLRHSAGVTWSDYELIKAEKGAAAFGLKNLPDHSPLGGPRWIIRLGEPLDELAAARACTRTSPSRAHR